MVQEKKILCMYSGGLDSLGVLYRLLTEPEYADFGLHVHHMHLKNVENRALAESKAIQATFRYFREKGYRNFLYTESGHDYSFMRRYFTFDTYWYAFMAANIITADSSIMHVAVGRTKSDMESAGSRMNANRGHEIFHATLPLELRFDRSYIYPVAHLTKQAVWNMLPADLRELSWSCRKPVISDKEPRPCGKCPTCQEMEKIRQNQG
ncbi:hypothetical protein [Desulfosudis oleivorans]|uniref:7-cyano-7-deazaguanine synthase n=1 Tax=Desulfosudis oleivorans (strain DSM 6200 / JCM 39069 / Hxd3) TaxID=96561 RepID=A8ZUB0_DESOH|nr:hypothetical protein [Desulfosudis oleivorans]ABW67942.1 hypothetical protein Dole_2138 [Desulfosudis oleivorans Hxd3]